MGSDDTFEWTPSVRRITPMRGQVVIRECKDRHTIWRPSNPRDVKIHRGVVIALGAPMRTTKGAEVPHGFEVGDVVLYAFQHHERAWTNTWSDGESAHWIPQWCVSGVVVP